MDLIPDHVAPERLYLETRWAGSSLNRVGKG
jgi:hypothetical protein